MRAGPAIHYVGVSVVSHSGAAISVRGWPHRAWRAFVDRYRPGLHEPLRHLVLHKCADLLLVLLEVGRDTTDRLAERVFYCRVEIEIIVLIGQSRLLNIGNIPAIRVFLDERLPRGAPSRRLAERDHARRADWSPIRVDPQVSSTDEIQSRMVEVVIRPVVDRDALSWQTVPGVNVEWEQRANG